MIASRLDALSLRINELQKQYSADFNIGDAVKDALAQLKELRLQASVVQPPVVVQGHREDPVCRVRVRFSPERVFVVVAIRPRLRTSA